MKLWTEFHLFPMQTQTAPHQATNLECPKCGKHTIVQTHDQAYSCLNCDFRRNFSQPPEPDNTLGNVFGTIILILMLLILL